MTRPSWAPYCGDGCTDLAHYWVWIEAGTFRHHLYRHEEGLDLETVQGLLGDACHEMLAGRPLRDTDQVWLEELVALIRFAINERGQVTLGYGTLGRTEQCVVRDLIAAALLGTGDT